MSTINPCRARNAQAAVATGQRIAGQPPAQRNVLEQIRCVGVTQGLCNKICARPASEQQVLKVCIDFLFAFEMLDQQGLAFVDQAIEGAHDDCGIQDLVIEHAPGHRQRIGDRPDGQRHRGLLCSVSMPEFYAMKTFFIFSSPEIFPENQFRRGFQ